MNKAIASLNGLVLAAACTCLLPLAAHAQGTQTAEGAQAFLASMAKRGFARATFIDALGRSNFVVGTHKVKTQRIFGSSVKEENSSDAVEKSLGELTVTALGSGDAQGAADACTTRIDEVKSGNLFDTTSKSWEEKKFLLPVIVLQNETWEYMDAFRANFNDPNFVDWRQAKVVRSNDGSRIDITAKGQKFATNTLSFVPGDSELADRIEYAAKFLRMSCDEVAETGF